jgi:hypothetical protein
VAVAETITLLAVMVAVELLAQLSLKELLELPTQAVAVAAELALLVVLEL